MTWPFMTADSYYPRDVAERTAIMQAGNVTVPGGLMRAAGHPNVRFRDEEIGRPPTPEEADRLGLSAGTAVIENLRIGYNRDDRPVRVIISIVPGDRGVIIRESGAE